MIYKIRSRARIVAVLKCWDGKVVDSASITGHWTWTVGREVGGILEWLTGHRLRWEVSSSDRYWEHHVAEIRAHIENKLDAQHAKERRKCPD